LGVIYILFLNIIIIISYVMATLISIF